MTKIKKIAAVSALLFILFAPSAGAQAFPSLVPAECRGSQLANECTLTSVETMATNLATIILGTSGSLALLMFIVGGIQYIMAGGNAKYAAKAKDTLMYAALGLVIVLFAGALIKFLVKSLTGV